jgi:formylglycine-generating enzyme required for sulfatase activity
MQYALVAIALVGSTDLQHLDLRSTGRHLILERPGRSLEDDSPDNCPRITWFADWADVIEHEVDPGVVTDPDGRERMLATGLPWRVRDRGTGIELLLVPPGEYVRGGSPDDPDARSGEFPAHRVRVSRPFYLGRTEVTQAQWLWVTGERPSRYTGSPLLPVERVSFVEIEAFLARTSLAAPRDSEWEYACRAGTTTPRYGELNEIAWNPLNSPQHTQPVATREPNPWGFFDMLGNVSEWNRTFYEWYSRGITKDIHPAEDDDSFVSFHRNVRGGAFGPFEENNRASCRSSSHPLHRREGTDSA